MTEPRHVKRKALGISNIVYGRQATRNRVTYLVDCHGFGDERAIPETVVLRRWRRREGQVGCVGVRLSPTLWRALPVVLGPDVSRWRSLTVEAIAACIDERRTRLRELRYSVPPAEAVRALLDVCRVPLLRTLVKRHRELGPRRGSGVPDLFLYRLDAGRVCAPHVVEVKKPGEPLSGEQKDELALLERHGLSAREFRLIER